MTDRTDRGFDRALAAAARSLVVAPLPVDVLEAPRPVPVRSSLRLVAPLAAAGAVVILAIGFAIRAPGGPGASPGPVFRTTAQISSDLHRAGYDCRSGAAASPGQPRMDAIVCTTTTPTLALAIVVSEDAAGRVGEVHVAVDLPGVATATTDRDRSDALRELIGMPLADPLDAVAARSWLAGVPPLDARERVATIVDGTPVVLERFGTDGYRIVLGDLHARPSAVPSAGPSG